MYTLLAQACEDNSLTLTHKYIGKDEYGKPQYEVYVTCPKFKGARRLEIISTWGQEPALECLAFLLSMAHEALEEKQWAATHAAALSEPSEYMLDRNHVYARLRRVLTDDQIIEFFLCAYDDENDAEN